MVTAFFKLLKSTAHLPTRKYDEDAAFDLYAAEDVTIPKKGSGEVDIGIAWEPKFDATMYFSNEEKMYLHMLSNFFNIQGKVEPRSGLSFKSDIETGAGVIDGTYRGCFKVKLYNHGNEPFQVKVGDRIAQFKIEVVPRTRVKLTNFLGTSDRDEKGFGSSGI